MNGFPDRPKVGHYDVYHVGRDMSGNYFLTIDDPTEMNMVIYWMLPHLYGYHDRITDENIEDDEKVHHIWMTIDSVEPRKGFMGFHFHNALLQNSKCKHWLGDDYVCNIYEYE